MEKKMKLNEKPLLPYQHLVLFAKGWIDFPWLKCEGDGLHYVTEQLKQTFKMDGYTYIANRDVLGSFMMAIDRIREAFTKNGQPLPYSFSSYYAFINGVESYRLAYMAETFKEALFRFMLSELMTLDIRAFTVKNIDYKKLKIKTRYCKESTTYTSCQRKFNRMFKDMLVPMPLE